MAFMKHKNKEYSEGFTEEVLIKMKLKAGRISRVIGGETFYLDENGDYHPSSVKMKDLRQRLSELMEGIDEGTKN